MKRQFTLAMAIAILAKKNLVVKIEMLPALLSVVLSFYSIGSIAQFKNTAFGTDALKSNTTGTFNTAIGYFSLYNNIKGFENSSFGAYSMYSNTSGNQNTSSGAFSLYLNSNGSGNTATGDFSLYSNIGSENTATGIAALFQNTSGTRNTAHGARSLYLNQTGYDNTAFGFNSLYNNTASFNTAIGSSTLFNTTTGFSNTANGYRSLYYNTTGNSNTAIGHGALYLNTTGIANTANGRYSLYSNTTGAYNTAGGYNSLYANTTGLWNTAIGYQSLYSNTTGLINTAIGYQSLYSNTTGSNNTALGTFANVSAGDLTNATAIGYNAKVDASNKVRIGNTFVTSIGGQVGWTTFSDGRYKKDIKENVRGLAFINSLRPLTYTINIKGLNDYYKKSATPVTDNEVFNNTKQAVESELQKGEDAAGKIVYNGFIAQEVEEAAKKLNYEFSGVDKPQTKDGLYGLRYENFIMPLVKAVQELSKMNNDKDAKIDDLIKRIEKLELMKNAEPVTSKIIALSDASLEQNIPNPFQNTTTIRYTLPQKFTTAQIIIADQSGKVLKQMNVSGTGKGTINVDATKLPSATYSYSLTIDGHFVDAKKMVLVK
jgi:trimeric autotransporter adhesin